MSVSVHFYSPGVAGLDVGVLRDWVLEKLPNALADVRADFFSHHIGSAGASSLARSLAAVRVSDPCRRFAVNEPLPVEVEYEERLLVGQASAGGVFYDGFELAGILSGMIPVGESSLSHVHVAFTDRLLATFDEDDLRYHARVIVCASPSIVSTGGFVEAPAKPREYYILRQSLFGDDAAVEALKREFAGCFVDYGDERLTEIAKGYVMQALFYQLLGEGFCSNPGCRLFNAHWQEEMIRAQLSGQDFCRRHQAMLSQRMATL